MQLEQDIVLFSLSRILCPHVRALRRRRWPESSVGAAEQAELAEIAELGPTLVAFSSRLTEQLTRSSHIGGLSQLVDELRQDRHCQRECGPQA